MGPSALRVAELGRRLEELGFYVRDFGNVPVTEAESLMETGPANARFLSEIARTCERLARLVTKALAEGRMPVVIGGDHSIATGTIAGAADYFRSKQQKIGLIWLDAHADMNTPETTPSGNIHGMPLACSTGSGPELLRRMLGFTPKVDPANVALIGIRDVDEAERINVRNSGIHAYTMHDLDERGMRAVMDEAIELACNGTAGFHLSVDMDFLDPDYAPGVGTPVRGGATYREAHFAMELIADCKRMLSIEVVEVNPAIDEVNRTAELAVELILSAMGKKIL